MYLEAKGGIKMIDILRLWREKLKEITKWMEDEND